MMPVILGVRVDLVAVALPGLGRTPPRQGCNPAAERFGDLLLEARVAQCPATIRRRAQVIEEVVIERGAK